jgi:competence protein ComEA
MGEAPDAAGAARARLRVGLGAAAVLLAVGIACAVLVSALVPRGQMATVVPGAPPPGTTAAPSPQSAPTIFVHILGAVARPGLYELREGDRAVDAVAAAGGFTPEADRSQLNLARFVTDGEQIAVPVAGAAAPVGGVPGGGAVVPGKVNINTADAATLETLPRVGPAMAERIIAWRDANGRFAAVEDLMSVSGVGEKTFESLRELVTV